MISRLFLALLLAALLVPSVPARAVIADTASTPADALATNTTLPPTIDAVYSTLSEAEDAGAVAQVPDDPEAFVQDEIIVILADEDFEHGAEQELASVKESVSALSDDGATAEAQLLSPNADSAPTALVELPADVSLQDALLELANDNHVAFAQPNYRYLPLDDDSPGAGQTPEASSALELLYTPDDPRVNDTSSSGQWWLGMVNAFGAWDTQKTNRAVTVAVIDTGVRLSHEDLKNNISPLAWDAYLDQPLATSASNGETLSNGDMSYHGTIVSGVVAAEADNGLLGAGVSFNAQILPINIFQSKGGGVSAETATVVKAFDYLIAHAQEANIRVANMSFGGYGNTNNDRALHERIQQATSVGILSVAAAGNANSSNACYPSDYDEVVSVTAVNQDSTRWVINSSSGSDFNAHKDIAAPGSGILTTYSSSDIAESHRSGTSLAAPVVSGIAALLFAKAPGLTPAQAKDFLCQSAADLGDPGRDDYFGWGLVDAQGALTALATSHTVTFAPGEHGAFVAQSTPGLHAGDATPTPPPTPAAVGWRFVSWQPAPAAIVTDNATYTAQWERIPAAVSQHEGSNRQDTAVQASAKAYPDPSLVDFVILAYSYNFPDALAASYLAGALDAPILLTDTPALDEATALELARLRPSTVYIVGGTGSVSENVERALDSSDFTSAVIRLGGAGREETAYLIANEAKAQGETPTTAFVADAANFPDALSAGSLSAGQGVPILLTATDELDGWTRRFLEENGIADVIIVGGPGSISEDVASELRALPHGPTVARWSGPERYATSKAVLDGAIATWSLTPTVIGLASGEDFPDALVGGAAVGNRGGLLAITDPNALSDGAASAISTHRDTLTDVEIFGGPGTIKVADEVQRLLA
jgi:putative cell wall-binding protein/subtilisin family serine protease